LPPTFRHSRAFWHTRWVTWGEGEGDEKEEEEKEEEKEEEEEENKKEKDLTPWSRKR
jgi:hypothetical protein